MKLPRTLIPHRPPPTLKNGHLHTIYAHFLPQAPTQGTPEPWEIPVSGGDRLAARHYAGQKPVVVYGFHGLSGCSESSYMQRLVQVCQRFDWHCVLVNHRGCGPGEPLAKLPYHAGRAEDLSDCIKFGAARLPHTKSLAVGFSLSANALGLLMTGQRGTTQPAGALCLNGPLDLANSSVRLSRGFTHVYDRHFAALCRKNLMDRHRKGLIDHPRLPWGVSLQQLDEMYTARLGGFDSREDYYAQASCFSHVEKIKRPTVFLTAEDDPIVDPTVYRNLPKTPSVQVHIEKYGGHLGFIQRETTPLGSRRWLDYAIAHFLRDLEQKTN